jgi:hypothetical protein
MKLTKRQHRTAKKLVLPLIAIGMMATMMFMESSRRASHGSNTAFRPAPGASARVAHDLRQR